MDLSAAWYDAIAVRTSQRRYAPTPLADDVVARLRVFCAADRASPGARLAVIDGGADRLFTGILGSYGAVAGAPLAAAFVGWEGHEGEVGYLGEAFVLEATALGLGTCWIAGTFDKELADDLVALEPGERVMAVTPLGAPLERRPRGERLMRRVMKASDRLPLETIAPGLDGSAGGGPTRGGAAWPAWARTAVAAARLAPSGVNRQPWRFRYDESGLVLTRAAKLYWTAPLDFGIARLHAELGAAHEGVRGVWQALAEPDVARFVAD
jgi:nitroreductase